MCEICGRIIGHNTRCPNYTPRKALHYCSSCGDGIYNGEEYIENLNGEYCHYDCIHWTREFIEWLGYKIKTMEE